MCILHTASTLSSNEKSWVCKLEAIFSCHRDDDVDDVICCFFWFLRSKSWRMRMLCSERNSSSTASRWLERRHRSDKKNGGEHHHSDTITNRVEMAARWGKQGLVKSHFLFSECILPWVPRSRTLHRPILAVLDCSNHIEITTHYNSVEMKSECFTGTSYEREPLLNSSLVLYLCSLTHGLWCLSFNFVPCQCIFIPQLLILT